MGSSGPLPRGADGVFTEYRGLTLAQLGDACGVSAAALSQIETGKREPPVGLLKKLAEALRADMDALVPSRGRQRLPVEARARARRSGRRDRGLKFTPRRRRRPGPP
ncbi:MAG: helix-turn-helix domain-containing protein [Gammaproteobacteria bacterium]